MDASVRRLGIAVCAILLLGLPPSLSPFGPRHASAQELKTCVPIKTLINAANAGKDIPVGLTPIVVLTVNGAACQRLIRNTGTAPMRCMPTGQGTADATTGELLNSGDQFLMGTEGREEWRCIQAGASGTMANTIEGIP